MKLFKRVKEDRGAANTVSFIVIILFVMTMLVSFIDVGIYFNTKNEMQSAAENGARNVALYGGTEGALRAERSASGRVNTPQEVVVQSIKTNYAPENAETKVIEFNGVEDVDCGPGKSPAGNQVYCEVSYKYNGLAGKFGFFQLGESNIVKVKGVAVSEVTLN